MLGYADEVWWSRLTQPNMHAWSLDQPLRLVGQQIDKEDQQSKEVWLPEQQNMLLRFVNGRPLSWVTCRFLDWVCQRLEEKGKQVKQIGGGRIITCLLPVKSPWLNPIEPRWLHGKRTVVDPNGKPSKSELMDRVYQHYSCAKLEPIAQPPDYALGHDAQGILHVRQSVGAPTSKIYLLVLTCRCRALINAPLWRPRPAMFA